MGDVTPANLRQSTLLARIAAEGFYDDPVMTWVFPNWATRLRLLKVAFTGLIRSYLPDRGTVHLVDNVCVTFWRPPRHNYASDAGDTSSPFTPDVVERFATMEAAMSRVHPRAQHWYLNVISTLPGWQGKGLGARALQPVLAQADADAIPAYLESSNPRNMTLYARHGFEQTGEIALPDGPSLYPMWREPRNV
jgi:GNAT superfamily N-acetyltransferase